MEVTAAATRDSVEKTTTTTTDTLAAEATRAAGTQTKPQVDGEPTKEDLREAKITGEAVEPISRLRMRVDGMPNHTLKSKPAKAKHHKEEMKEAGATTTGKARTPEEVGEKASN